MTRTVISRVGSRVGAIVSALTIASALLAGAATPTFAGNTRDIYFGSPPANLANCDASTTFCPLTFSATSATTNPRSFVDVVVANLGNQTVNHLVASGGTAADTAQKNTTPTPPPGNSIPSPLTIQNVYPAPGSSFSCAASTTPSTPSFSCNIGQLGAGQSAQFRVVLEGIPPVSTTNIPVWFMVSLNESSTTGSNQDEFYATGSVTWTSAGCGFNGNYFSPGENVAVSQQGVCTDQPTSISGPNTPQGAFASVGTTSTTWCPPGFSCFGLLSMANENFGVGGPVIWTITWGSRPKGVIHFLDGYDPVLNPNAYENLPFKGSTKCPTNPGTMLCWYSLTTNGGLTTAVFQTATNGSGRSY